MSQGKLKRVHVIIIGLVACIAVGAGMYFLVISKLRQDIAALQTRYDEAKAVADTRPQVERKLAAAQAKYQIALARYNYYLRTKMPPISFQDRAQGMIALWKEQAETLGPMIEAWPKKTKVVLGSSVQVPAAPVDPNAINTTLIRIPIGTIRVVGDFKTLMNHIRSWKNFGRLVQVDPASLSGVSPNMVAEYGLTVYIFPYGEPGPPVQMAGTGGASTGG